VEWIVLDDFPDTGPFRGRDGTLRFWKTWSDSFADFYAQADAYVEAGDSVIVMTRMVGRGKDSGVAVDTPVFAMVSTVRDRAVVRMEMFETKEAALGAVGLPSDTPFESF